MQKKTAGTVLQNFTAAAAARPIPIIFTEALQTLMKLAVSFRKNGLNAPL